MVKDKKLETLVIERTDLNTKIINALNDVVIGKPIIIVDDYDRENEGDLFIAASEATFQNIAFMIREGGGLMCIPCSGEILDRLCIPMMVPISTDKMGTPFTVSVDAINKTTSGMSVDDRLKTIEVFLNEESKPEDLSRPGHMFPLRAKRGLLSDRRGHTEAAIELTRVCSLPEVAIIVEIMDGYGNMSRGDTLEKFAKYNDLQTISVEDIYSYTHTMS